MDEDGVDVGCEMRTLADSFLQDLDDLEDDEGDHPTENNVIGEDDDVWNEPIVDAIEEYWTSLTENTFVVSDLAKQDDFRKILDRVRELTCEEPSTTTTGGIAAEEYELVEQCNGLVNNIDSELLRIHRFARDVYSKKFPELEQIVYAPLDYIAIVKRVQNETNLTLVDLSDLLPNTVIMAVTVAASMTTGSPLAPAELDKVVRAADEAVHLADCRRDVLGFLESRMSLLAPNLSSVLGSALAARLITQAAGLSELAKMPAQNVMLLGAPRRGWSSTGAASMGIICQSEIVQSVPLGYRSRAIRLLSGKCSLAARVDSFRESPGGEVGRAYREGIINSLLKAQEAPPAPQKKALPIPDEKPRVRRGGKRYRRMKEKYSQSEFMKEANRMKFGTEAEDEFGLNSGKGFGMLGKSTGMGKLSLQAKQGQKLHLSKKRQQQLQKSGTSTSGVFQSGRTTLGPGGAVTSIVNTGV
eukprot:CAMPEP_0113844740 /NCGR_PEP_ID=MMETSP0372-20130328/392_1 /TAXON_ID=340204 /ORGANISM="Lankesteria abbotti" /LENGTH=470 /DNA_ID=CAMNT_0000813751 /DNA_START=46 /DNA_END=1458 /DNA_ORIENTATION=+ /assembly_acc=CAM_ASM_000359